MTTKFWLPSPPPLWRDLRALSLLVPAVAVSLGAVAFSIQGQAATQGGVLPATWVELAIRWGAVLLGFGCEAGTLSALVEVSRKRRDGDAVLLRVLGMNVNADYAGVFVSYLSTVLARLLALQAGRSALAITALVLASAADAYVLFAEYGDYTAIRNRNFARWLRARDAFDIGDLDAAEAALRGDRVQVRAMPAQLHATDTQLHAERAPVRATKSDWLRIVSGLNGERAHLDAVTARALIVDAGFLPPSESTVNRWTREVKNG